MNWHLGKLKKRSVKLFVLAQVGRSRPLPSCTRLKMELRWVRGLSHSAQCSHRMDWWEGPPGEGASCKKQPRFYYGRGCQVTELKTELKWLLGRKGMGTVHQQAPGRADTGRFVGPGSGWSCHYSETPSEKWCWRKFTVSWVPLWHYLRWNASLPVTRVWGEGLARILVIKG